MKQSHDKCKNFNSKRNCPPLRDKNDIMLRATQEISEYSGGSYSTLQELPTNDEIDALCEECKSFTHK